MKMKASISALAVSLLVVLAACSSDPEIVDELAEEDESALIDGKADALGSTFSYFLVEPDFRKCVFPLCGGFWVSHVNRLYTRCADGNWSNRCYVTGVDLSALGFGTTQRDTLASELHSGRIVVRGSMGQTDEYPTFGTMGVLRATEAWRSATEGAPSGIFARVTDSGIVCITTPCYNTLHEAKLNSFLHIDFSELDLTGIGASEEQINDAFAEVAGDDGLLVAGYRYYFYDKSWQRGRVATQFYTRVRPQPETTTCVRSGCSGQLCVDASWPPMYTTCEFLPEYACYQAATCEVQPEGICGFTVTPELETCLDEASNL